MIILPYLRDGRVYSSQDAFENSDVLGSYRVVTNVDDGTTFVETDPIGGKVYRSIANWSETDREKERDFGYLPLKRQ